MRINHDHMSMTMLSEANMSSLSHPHTVLGTSTHNHSEL